MDSRSPLCGGSNTNIGKTLAGFPGYIVSGGFSDFKNFFIGKTYSRPKIYTSLLILPGKVEALVFLGVGQKGHFLWHAAYIPGRSQPSPYGSHGDGCVRIIVKGGCELSVSGLAVSCCNSKQPSTLFWAHFPGLARSASITHTAGLFVSVNKPPQSSRGYENFLFLEKCNRFIEVFATQVNPNSSFSFALFYRQFASKSP